MENEKVEEQETSETPAEKETAEKPAEEEAPVEQPQDEADPAAELQEKNKHLFERAKKAETEAKELKARIAELEAQDSPSEVFSENPTQDTEEVQALRKRLDAIEEKAALENIYVQYPAIKSKIDDFDAFREDYPRHKLENVAKLFLAENDLLKSEPRKGLEKPTGGTRTPPSTGKVSVEDAKRLRETNYEAYRKAVMEGKIQIED